MDIRIKLDLDEIKLNFPTIYKIINTNTLCTITIFFKMYIMMYSCIEKYSNEQLFDNITKNNILEYFDIDTLDINEFDNCDLENFTQSMPITMLKCGLISKYNVGLLSSADINIYCNMYHVDNIIDAIKKQNNMIKELNKQIKSIDNDLFKSRGYDLVDVIFK